MVKLPTNKGTKIQKFMKTILIKSNYLHEETSNGSHSHLGVISEVNLMIQYLLLIFIEENEVS